MFAIVYWLASMYNTYRTWMIDQSNVQKFSLSALVCCLVMGSILVCGVQTLESFCRGHQSTMSPREQGPGFLFNAVQLCLFVLVFDSAFAFFTDGRGHPLPFKLVIWFQHAIFVSFDAMGSAGFRNIALFFLTVVLTLTLDPIAVQPREIFPMIYQKTKTVLAMYLGVMGIRDAVYATSLISENAALSRAIFSTGAIIVFAHGFAGIVTIKYIEGEISDQQGTLRLRRARVFCQRLLFCGLVGMLLTIYSTELMQWFACMWQSITDIAQDGWSLLGASKTYVLGAIGNHPAVAIFILLAMMTGGILPMVLFLVAVCGFGCLVLILAFLACLVVTLAGGVYDQAKEAAEHRQGEDLLQSTTPAGFPASSPQPPRLRQTTLSWPSTSKRSQGKAPEPQATVDFGSKYTYEKDFEAEKARYMLQVSRRLSSSRHVHTTPKSEVNESGSSETWCFATEPKLPERSHAASAQSSNARKLSFATPTVSHEPAASAERPLTLPSTSQVPASSKLSPAQQAAWYRSGREELLHYRDRIAQVERENIVALREACRSRKPIHPGYTSRWPYQTVAGARSSMPTSSRTETSAGGATEDETRAKDDSDGPSAAQASSDPFRRWMVLPPRRPLYPSHLLRRDRANEDTEQTRPQPTSPLSQSHKPQSPFLSKPSSSELPNGPALPQSSPPPPSSQSQQPFSSHSIVDERWFSRSKPSKPPAETPIELQAAVHSLQDQLRALKQAQKQMYAHLLRLYREKQPAPAPAPLARPIAPREQSCKRNPGAQGFETSFPTCPPSPGPRCPSPHTRERKVPITSSTLFGGRGRERYRQDPLEPPTPRLGRLPSSSSSSASVLEDPPRTTSDLVEDMDSSSSSSCSSAAASAFASCSAVPNGAAISGPGGEEVEDEERNEEWEAVDHVDCPEEEDGDTCSLRSWDDDDDDASEDGEEEEEEWSLQPSVEVAVVEDDESNQDLVHVH